MKKNLLLFGMLASVCCGTSFSQSKINGAGRLMLDSYQMQERTRGVSQAPDVLVLVTLESGETADVLETQGYEVTNVVGSMAMVRVSLDKVEALAALKEVKTVSFGTESRPYLDVAREISNVDVVHDGTGDGLSGHAYTGKGVTVGLYDTGLDPNHAAFRDANGNSRVKAIYVRRSDTAANQDVTSPEDIASFTTEATSESHGTHVLGIIAGTNSAEGRIPSNGNGKIPFYGPSYESDIVIGCGDFTDNAILDGIASVVKKAKEIGQPAVVNLSLGSNNGAHDPNSDRSRFLDELGKDAIICISAGNEGGLPMAVKKRFTAMGAGKNLNTFIVPQTTNSTNATTPIFYTAEFWADSEEEFTFSLVIYDRSTGKVIESVPVSKGGSGRLASSTSSLMASQYDGASYMSATADVDKATGRYNVYIVGNVTPTQLPSYLLGVNISAGVGREVRGYVNALSSSKAEAIFSSENISGYTAGTDDGTINGFGCGHNMISVGAYVSRTSAPYVASGSYAGSGTVGDIASFSSYGETADGRQLPHVCGPGAQVVSSVSSYWMRNVMSDAVSGNRFNAYSSQYGRDSYWYPMQGTSMSSPFVAGVVGLWLQAWPDMTVQQCLDIINESSIQDRYTKTNTKRWGAGKIDALAGLKLAIERHASLEGVSADSNERNLVIQNLGDRRYEISYVGAGEVAVDVYSIQGARVLAVSSDTDTVELDASALTEGIYVVNVATPAGNVARKLAVK